MKGNGQAKDVLRGYITRLKPDTYSATAQAHHIVSPETAYVKGQKVIGTLQKKTLDAKENGEYKAPEGTLYERVNVDVDTSIPDGYILPSGTEAINANGEYDVTEKAKVNVNVPIPEGYVIPEGEVTITENGEHDISGKAKAIVNVAGGGSGECSGEHIIEVDELPTENIKQKTFYALKQPFSDVIVLANGEVMSYGEYMTAEGATVEFYTIPTKTTENIRVSNFDTMLVAFYYIEDENDILLYGDAYGNGTNDWVSTSLLLGGTFGGCISTKEEATLAGVYYALGGAVEYYQYADHGFVDVLEVEDDGAILSYIELYAELGMTVPLTSLSTKPTEATDGYYYIEDEDALYLYNSNGWNAETPFNGVITDKAQATEVGYYALFRRGFEQYVVASGSLKIEHNGTHPVADKAEVIVNVPTIFMAQTVAELPTDCTNGSMAIVLGGE